MCLRSARPAICRVGNGGQPGPSEYTDPNCASKNRQSIARESFTSACVRSMIRNPAGSGTDPAPPSLVAPVAASLTLPRSSQGQGITASDSKESQKQFARKPQRRRPIPAKTIACNGSITHLVQRLGNTSRATNLSLRLTMAPLRRPAHSSVRASISGRLPGAMLDPVWVPLSSQQNQGFLKPS